MFGQLIAALKSGDQLDTAFAEFMQMIDASEWMFHEANDVLCGEKKSEDVGDALYERDKDINRLLRSVRARIVTHLSVNPIADIPGCLALMSVAKDAERIGDYCKNVFEVGQYYEDGFSIERYHDPLDVVRKRTGELFGAVRDALDQSSVKKAKSAIKMADKIRGECDAIEETLLRDRREVQTHVAVAYSLLARHYKRVASHLANIATSVFGRIEDLDFRKPKKSSTDKTS